MGVKDISLSSGTTYRISLDKIVIDKGWNIREDYGDIESFANHILENGITFPPLKGYIENNLFHVTQGHRRRLACLKAVEKGADLSKGLECTLEPKTKSPEERIAEQVSSNEGKNYTPLEKALVCKKLTSFSWQPKDISKLTNIPLPQVYNYLNYIAPQSNKILQLIRDKTVSLSTVVDVAKQVGVDRTYQRLVELNGRDPLELDDEDDEDDNMTVITSLDELSSKKKKNDKIKNPSKLDEVKKVWRVIIKEADIDDMGDLINITMTKENFELLEELLTAKKKTIKV